MASPDDWAGMLDRAPTVEAEAGLRSRVVVRRWRDTHPDVSQPSLNQHYVVLHLGGPKRVRRRGGDGVERVVDVTPGALSLISAGRSYQWSTQGAIDYAHVYVPPRRLRRAAIELFDRDPSSLAMLDEVGIRDDLLSELFTTLLGEVSGAANSLYVDTLYDAFLGRLLTSHSNLGALPSRTRSAMTPRRVSAVMTYIEANLEQDISLDDLAAQAQLSRFHFVRAFSACTGLTPHAYLMERRLEAAKRLLADGGTTVEAVARRCGFASASHLARRFRQATGLAPTTYRDGV